MIRKRAAGSEPRQRKCKLRRFTAAFLTLTLFFSFPAGAEAKSRQEEYIQVGLKYGSSAVNECVLKSDDGFQVVNITEDGPEDTLPLPAYREIVASVENGTIVIRDPDGTMLVSDMGTTGALMPLDYEDGDGTVVYSGTEYRDGIRLTVYKGSAMNVINYITMDHYLYGVIHGEMSQSYPLEALKAQAVVARSFAGQNRTHAKDGFNVCSTTHCQVYKGFAGEYPKTTQAVDETAGEMMYSEGEIVQAFYFKNSGGHTQNSEDVWSAKEPYLRGVKDEYSPDYSWSATMTFEQIKSRLEAANYSPGTIESVAITGHNSAGAVSELTVKGSGGTVTLKKESVRTVLGGSDIKSTMFVLKNGSAGGSMAQTPDEIYATNGSSTKKTGSTLYVLSSSGSANKTEIEDICITDGSSTASADGAGKSGETVSIVTDGKVVFEGKGYGHGIGMPQDSAIKMAQEGMDYEEILEYFFTDIQIR